MAMIRPCADLRNNYNEISKLCHETNEPVYITKNGYNDLVLLSNEAYEKYEEERIDRLISEHFDKNYPDFQTFREDIFKQIDEALKDIENGNYQSLEDFCAEMEAEYHINE